MPRMLSFSLVLLVSGCDQESVDVTGEWSGEARMTIDGEHKNVPLLLELVHSEQTISGAITWDDVRQVMTAGSSEGPELRFESKTDNATLSFNGLYRNETIEGRFTITYRFDPEPFPGQFSVTRQE